MSGRPRVQWGLDWISRWRGRDVFNGTGFESQRYLTKWLLLGSIIGVVAGLGAVLFYLAIGWATDFFLGQLAGYAPPSPVGEGAPTLTPIARPWLLPLVTGLGGLISGIIVFNLAPEAEGHGTDSAIDAIHHKGGRIRPRIPPIKLIASAITIGSGGSGGREGPAAQISAGFGSLLSEWLKLGVMDRRIAVAAGMGAGIGAIFRAPLGGAVMAAEILYIHDLEVEALIPSLIASIVGYSVYGAFFGYAPIFGAQPQLGFDHPVQLLYYAALGVICGAVGLLYTRSFYGITAFFHRIKLPKWFKPAIGGVLVGLMGIVLPGALHMGYGWVQLGMTKQDLLGFPLWVVLLLPFAKILSTSLSIGSGGSGGIFGPGMVVGGMLGASFWRLGEGFLPQMPTDPAPLVIIGMMALFGGIAHAPLAVMLMVAEMTGNLSLLAPAMVAVAISTALVGSNTIYRSQLPTRADSPAHRVRFSFPLLSSLLVRDAISGPGATIDADAPIEEARSLLEQEGASDLIAVDKDGSRDKREFAGVVTREKLQRLAPTEIGAAKVRSLLSGTALTLKPDESLQDALEKLSDRTLSWAPVVDNKVLVGRLTARNIMQAYKRTLQRSVSRTQALTNNTVMFEARISAASPLAGHLLREIKWPPNTLVVSVSRGGETIFPRADTQLRNGDAVLIMADPVTEPALRTFLEGTHPGSQSTGASMP
ncbi:MAG: chloride channel protein [Chloroflexota bacterium]|nr:chloride channel protein [Chloroflexota bacterium]